MSKIELLDAVSAQDEHFAAQADSLRRNASMAFDEAVSYALNIEDAALGKQALAALKQTLDRLTEKLDNIEIE